MTNRAIVAAVMAVFLTFASAQAQDRSPSRSPQTASAKKSKRGPRAIAVLEFLPGGAMRLVPVALLMDGHYYDASLYDANPAPMAVEPQTVYEAQSFGEPTGTFTITTPKQVNGNWVADGSWAPHMAMDEKLSGQAAKDAANKSKNPPGKAVTTAGTDDSRPVLKRAPGSAGDSGSGSQSTPSTQTASSSDSDRPVMKRPANDSSSKPTLGSADDTNSSTKTSAKSQPPVADHAPDSPAMEHPSPTSSEPGSSGVRAQAAASNDSDPNRPTLSRTSKPKPQTTTASDVATPKEAMAAGTAKGARSYPAISDAGDYRGRPMLYSMSPGERKTQEDQVRKLALDEIRAFAAKRNGPSIPNSAVITDYDVRAFDLDYSSSPTIVLTAKLPINDVKANLPPGFTYFATIVARVDINDQPIKIYSSVTDSRHLDAFPRLELIDALDADANGRGDLLFRQYSDGGISYALYRVSAYQLDKVFEGGSAL